MSCAAPTTKRSNRAGARQHQWPLAASHCQGLPLTSSRLWARTLHNTGWQGGGPARGCGRSRAHGQDSCCHRGRGSTQGARRSGSGSRSSRSKRWGSSSPSSRRGRGGPHQVAAHRVAGGAVHEGHTRGGVRARGVCGLRRPSLLQVRGHTALRVCSREGVQQEGGGPGSPVVAARAGALRTPHTRVHT